MRSTRCDCFIDFPGVPPSVGGWTVLLSVVVPCLFWGAGSLPRDELPVVYPGFLAP